MESGQRDTRPLGQAHSGPPTDAWVSTRPTKASRPLPAETRDVLLRQRRATLEASIRDADEVMGRYRAGVEGLRSVQLDGEADRERLVALHRFEEAGRLLDEARQRMNASDGLAPDQALEHLAAFPPERLQGAIHLLHGFYDHFGQWPECAGLFPPPRPGEGGGLGTRRLMTQPSPVVEHTSEPARRSLWSRMRDWLKG